MTVHDLREVLRERAGAPSPGNPLRHDQVRARISRARRRRRAAATVTAGAAAAVLAMALLPGAERGPEETTTATAGERLPGSYTSGDGAVYRRLAAAALRPGGPATASVTVPATGGPLDVAGVCEGSLTTAPPRVLMNGRPVTQAAPLLCGTGVRTVPLTVPAGVTEVTVTFDQSARPLDCRSAGGGCAPGRGPAGAWDLAVYTWTPPARPVDPGPVGHLPRRVGGLRLAGSATGTLAGPAAAGAFTVRVRSRDGHVRLQQLCAGELSGRLWFSYLVDGASSVTTSCPVLAGGGEPAVNDLMEVPVPAGRQVTITGRVGAWGPLTNRPVRWSAGVYAED
ncbi:hypothetical protein MF672_035650 [Actinomadura sp. ATCC 31491]|uniref:Uncharacterized protein n=1 Tax=Actinomadura luzonensis TaxID=2805427 RepID=A0ABT0G3V8_9ACTN|nr:hypothetical protein [Actinomadura luzonensis]MCK2219093.1 hypothetical protein [Actinomadura luzonensis]